ncbi:hypothetical protein AYI69_g6200 [Smittium culicis]|uniref:Uncharacterized protein n=1 Tax=Smittium culicis TaxID=133412 RepID=A0A1R1Y0I6_9FUNG|nr:hypothetical protein AYI69_g6200 [Smittium culicis]
MAISSRRCRIGSRAYQPAQPRHHPCIYLHCFSTAFDPTVIAMVHIILDFFSFFCCCKSKLILELAPWNIRTAPTNFCPNSQKSVAFFNAHLCFFRFHIFLFCFSNPCVHPTITFIRLASYLKSSTATAFSYLNTMRFAQLCTHLHVSSRIATAAITTAINATSDIAFAHTAKYIFIRNSLPLQHLIHYIAYSPPNILPCTPLLNIEIR